MVTVLCGDFAVFPVELARPVTVAPAVACDRKSRLGIVSMVTSGGLRR
jgi:hypothetical protein